MRRLCTELPFTCVTCGIEIRGTPEFYVGLPFCCGGCVANGPCICSYDETGRDRTPVADRTAVAPSAAVEADASATAEATPEGEEALVLSGR